MTTVPVLAIVMLTTWSTATHSKIQPPAGNALEARCPCCGGASQFHMVEVPTWVTEKQICKQTKYRNEERTRTCTVCCTVPVTKEGVVKYTEYVQKSVENKREIEIKKPVAKVVEQKYKIQVPAKDKVTQTRMVKKCVPVTEMRKVCENGVETEVPVTCNKEVCVEETYECEVDVCAEVEQTRKVTVWDTKVEKKTVVDKTKTVVAVPKTKKVPVTVMEEVQQERVETYTVCVPYEENVEVDVCVLRMVPTPVPARCANCQ